MLTQKEEFFLALADGNLAKVNQILLSNSAILKEKFCGTEEPPLHLAIRYVKKSPSLKIIQAILNVIDAVFAQQKHEILNAKNHRGQTALHLAMKFGLIDVANLLLQYGIDYRVLDEQKGTARDVLKVFYSSKLNEYDRLIETISISARESKEEKSTSHKMNTSESTPLLSDVGGEEGNRRRTASSPDEVKASKISANSASLLGGIAGTSGSSQAHSTEEQVLLALHLKNL